MPTKIISCKVIIVLLLMGCLSGCSNGREEENDILLNGVNASLIIACQNSDEMSRQIMRAFQKMASDAVNYDEYIKDWLPKADSIRKSSKEAYDFIENLKQRLSKKSVSPYNLMLKNSNGIELHKTLKQYRKNLLAVDSAIHEEFIRDTFVAPKCFDSLPEKEKNFAEFFFKDASIQQATVTLSKFQCDIKALEFQILSFWFKKASPDINQCEFWIPRIVAYHTSKYVMPNEMMEVHVGIEDDYIRRMQPIVSIDEKPVKINNDFFAMRNIKASDKIGKHSLPIGIRYRDNKTGEIRGITKMFEYYVDSIRKP